MHTPTTPNAATPNPQQLRELYRRPLWKPVVQSAVNLAAYAALAALAIGTAAWPLKALAWAGMGLLLAGCVNVAHDCLHSTHLDSRRANRVAGSLWCAPALVNFSLFRHSHLLHHRYTLVPGDPEPHAPITSVTGYLRRVFVHNPFAPPLRNTRKVFGAASATLPDAVRRPGRRDAAVVCAWLALMAGLTALHPLALVQAYWIPLLLMHPLITLTALPEHHDRQPSADVFTSTGSVVSNAILRHAMWSGGFHAEHHFNPGVPSCNLLALHAAMRAGRTHSEPSYVRYHFRLVRQLIKPDAPFTSATKQP